MQKIRIRNTDIDLTIQDMVYPFVENGLLYLRMIVLNYAGEPTEFLSIMPQDILYRISDYDESTMNEINVASEQALEDQAVRMAVMEDEMTKKAEETSTEEDFDPMHYG